MNLRVSTPSFCGTMTAPSSKSHTLRALICASLADDTSFITAPLISGDMESAVQVLRQLGVTITEVSNNPLVFKVTPPVGGLLASAERGAAERILDLGNSGSLLYFLGMILAAADMPVCLTGDESLRSRPVEPLLSVYRQAGIPYSAASIKNGTGSMEVPPLRFCGPLPAGSYQLDGPFSQPVTGLLLAAPLLNGMSHITFNKAGERPYLRMTCAWLRIAGIEVLNRDDCYSCGGFNTPTLCVVTKGIKADCNHLMRTTYPDAHVGVVDFEVAGGQRYHAFTQTIPGDWSSALFPLTAAVICNAALTLTNLDPADTQGDSQALSILKAMGADIRCDAEHRTVSVFPISGELKGGRFDCADIPDAVPILACAAMFCTGETLLLNAGVCRFKECDRLAASAEELAKFGADITQGEDFLRIGGSGGNSSTVNGSGGQKLHPARVRSRGDHRIAMMLAVAACGIAARYHSGQQSDTTRENTEKFSETSCIEDFDCVKISYPRFIEDMNAVGAAFKET